MNVEIKTRDGKFQVGIFDKRDPFPCSFVRRPDKSSNVPSSIVYSTTGVESLSIARASSNPDLFSTATKLLTVRISR